MDLLNGKIRPIYQKYLAAAFGSTLITSIYSTVDMAMVGQYHGPNGSAALAVMAPLWNLIFSLGLLTGIGGSVIFSTKRGSGSRGEENEYFTASVIASLVLAALAWAALLLFDRPLLLFFGADDTLLSLAQTYMRPIKWVFPLFLLNQMLSAFVRNDNRPGLATASVLTGGIFNVFGDYFFVFTLDMGIYGAGLATAIGSALSMLVMLTHFFHRNNTLRLVRVHRLLHLCGEIAVTGFPTFFVDVAMGILTILFNRQIMRYLGADALAVYGPVINVSTFVQCCAYSVGQASQPIFSTNFGAGRGSRIRAVLRCAIETSIAFGVFWTALSMAVPDLYIHIFMKPTDTVLAIAPAIIRRYALSFLLLPFNIFSTYYFQSIRKPGAAFVVSVMRGLVISGALILLLPSVAGPNSIWFAMPITELAVLGYVIAKMRQYTRALPETGAAESEA